MVTLFYAHSGNRSDQSDWQPLHEHLTGTALNVNALSRVREGFAKRSNGWMGKG